MDAVLNGQEYGNTILRRCRRRASGHADVQIAEQPARNIDVECPVVRRCHWVDTRPSQRRFLDPTLVSLVLAAVLLGTGPVWHAASARRRSSSRQLLELVAQNALGVSDVGRRVVAVRCAVRQPEIVALALLSLVLAWPAEKTAFQLLTTDRSCGPALGLCAFAFGLMRRDSSWLTQACAALLMALGAWTNAGTGLLMLAVFTVAAAMPRLRPDAMCLLGGVVLSLAGHLALQKLAPGVRLDTSHLTLASLADVRILAVGFWSDAYQRFLGPAVWLTVDGSARAWRGASQRHGASGGHGHRRWLCMRARDGRLLRWHGPPSHRCCRCCSVPSSLCSQGICQR